MSCYRYDPTAVLDFLWALTCNPKLWQGRDKFTPKHYIPENILLLEERQLLNLVAYLVSEAVIICNMQNRNAAFARMDIRLDLLLHCISTEDKLISKIVNYLAQRMMDNTEYESYRFIIAIVHFITYGFTFVASIYNHA
jgi:integrator complex subunit 1